MRQFTRFLAICVAVGCVLATRTTPVTAACTLGTVSSPLGNFESFDPSTSSDGRYTAFWSLANDLVGGDSNGRYDIFVVDRQTCAMERVSVSSAGVESNSDSMHPAISADGRYVAFVSSANNLVASDSNNSPDIFVRDRQAGTTVRASVTNAGAQASSGLGSARPDISGDGRFVAFLSFATNLVTGDLNGAPDVFVRDLVGLTTQRVSVDSAGTEGIDGDTQTDRPSISADGRYVAFASTMTNLVAGDTNVARDIFRHDRQTGETVRVSVSSGGAQTPNSQDSTNPSISGDGRYVAFDSFATNLVVDDTDFNYDVFVRDVDAGLTTRVSLVNQGGPAEAFAWAQSVAPAISADGRYVAFTSGAEDLVAGDDNGWQDVFVRDRATGITRRVSTSFDGVQGDFNAGFADISGDGAVVAFSSFSSTLVAGDGNNADDVFVAEWRLISDPPNVDLMRNGDFEGGMNRWSLFALPNMTYVVSHVTAGVFNYYRVAPPPATPGQAVVYQQTTAQLLPSAPVVATFNLGNSNSVAKRISVLIHDADFTDLHVCTMWIPALSPMRPYTMRSHTTKAWANATISFYAASPNSDGGFLRIDNVTLRYAPTEAADRTDCVDPSAPAATLGLPGPNLLANGDFSGGMTSWGTFGQINFQFAGGVFEFIRPPGTPAGVIAQSTGQAMTAGQILTATFDLGNSSPVRKRVTVVLHDTNFSDIAACTFWLPPGVLLETYQMRTYATKNGTDPMHLSVYPATVGMDQWMRLDNVSLQRTPATAILGTECLEPGGSVTPPPGRSSPIGGVAGGTSPSQTALRGDRDQPRAKTPSEPVVSTAGLKLWMPPSDEVLEIQVSEDGDTWQTLHAVEPSEDWRLVTLDLSRVTSRVMFVRVKCRGAEAPRHFLPFSSLSRTAFARLYSCSNSARLPCFKASSARLK
jgi:Tol biopolymer transport system component